MSHDFSRISIEQLCSWILKESAQGHIFGIHQSLFFTPRSNDPFSMTRYGIKMESPIGVAAGPHTQMAQNIIAAWLCGSRFIELKTVQTLDQLNVSKPCIDMEDEGYNCEWSQELRLDDSFDEYLNAWVLLHVLRHKFGWKSDRGPGFIFNMSVGYNMEGILKDNVQKFFERMENCKTQLEAKRKALKKVYPKIDEIDIPHRLSDNITLSTMHGCPPEEIEKIGMYLLTKRKLHTAIKLNPTLLGPDHLRSLLNRKLGFEATVPDEAFGHDLKYPDALKLIESLRGAAKRENLHFSLKLTNTLESLNHKTIFPPNEKMMYLSGRPLHPISVNVAAKLQNEFNGELDISFSAGADCFNLPEIISCGIKPVTVCSDILKPGGYARLSQYLEELGARMKARKADSIDSFILSWDGRNHGDVSRAALTTLRQYAGIVGGRPEYAKEAKQGDTIKTARVLEAFDCVSAPCINACSAVQDIPSYLHHTAKGDYKKAYEVILKTNPLPSVCGMVCDHLCQYKCTRSNYDNPILIREIKRFITEKNENRAALKPAAKNGLKVAVIGAGPSGLSCSFFLALEGYEVTIFETKAFGGGMISDAIPSFRLTDQAIRQDIEFIQGLGVRIRYDQKMDKHQFKTLKKEYNFVYIAIGAQKAKSMGISGEEAEGVLDCLKFLSDVRQGKKTRIGPRVAVIGGGNTAMDVARTALRFVGGQGKVTVLYRRTRKEMPADPDEIKSLREENIDIVELVAPLSVLIRDKKAAGLRCLRMRLGAKGADGRAKFEKIPGSEFEMEFDTIIPAIGQDVVPEFVGGDDLQVDPATGMTRMENVFAGGDAVRGGSTLIRAIGDGRIAAQNIAAKAARHLTFQADRSKKGMTPEKFQLKSARRERGVALPEIGLDKRHGFDMVIRTLSEAEARKEAGRCLYCHDVCNVCVTVCPNRANLSYAVKPGDYAISKAVRKGGKYKLEKSGTFRLAQDTQIINVGDFCNECGNCTTFCPTAGRPFKDKPKFYLTEESFSKEKEGFHFSGHLLKARFEGLQESITEKEGVLVYHAGDIKAKLNRESLSVESVSVDGKGPGEIIFDRALKLGVLYNALKSSCFTG